MTTHKHIDRLCIIVAILTVLAALLFMNAGALGVAATEWTQGYEDRLFDRTQVHTIDIVMDDWDAFIEACENEEYAACTVVIDGEPCKNVGIRAKGNTSLSSVSSMNSDRYSFKIEFDQYDSTQNYYGLDKLSLNNLIQDNTFMKDFLVYQMMNEFDAAAPLCSYAYITVNGRDWGLYLAVEGVEESFLRRNYGPDYGELYKPDSMDMGGGRGNGMDFAIGNSNSNEDLFRQPENTAPSFAGIAPNMGEAPGTPGQTDPFGQNRNFSGGSKGGGTDPGMGSSDVKLQYIDDDPDSYPNIFDNAKTDVTSSDKIRLIRSLQTLSQGGEVSSVVDIDAALRYFVVHNFVVNGDSYTGSMIHNYYLYEKNGLLSMLPWDYNLAFGTFQGSDAASAVNEAIDLTLSDRPMVSWIFDSREYTDLYHQYFSQFLSAVFDSGWFRRTVSETTALIAPYVERDPTKFCTFEEFESGVETITRFCTLRAESVAAQLNGEVSSVDPGDLDLSRMGTMGGKTNPGNGSSTEQQSGGRGQIPDGTAPSGRQQPGQALQPGFSRPDFGSQEHTQSGFPTALAPSSAASGSATVPIGGLSLLLFCGSALLLSAGIIIALKYRRR